MVSQKAILFFFFAYYFMSEMTWRQALTVGTLMVGGFLFLIYKSQEKILYLNEQLPPKRTSENPSPFKNPKEHYMNYQDVWLKTKDGLKLHCWFIPASSHSSDSTDPSHSTDKPGTIVWFHANAGNMGHRLPNLQKMHKELDCNIFILSYRGYGESEGEPNEEGIKIDADTVMEYIISQANSDNNYLIDLNKLFIFGRSMGGAVAAYITHKYDDKITGLILENTFLSISDMVGKVFPFLNFKFIKDFMLKIHWRSVDLVPSIKCPILFLASEQDEIVPHNHMLQLHDMANNSSFKLIHKITDGMHNDAWLDTKGGTQYWMAMREFMDQATQLKKQNKIDTNDINNSNEKSIENDQSKDEL